MTKGLRKIKRLLKGRIVDLYGGLHERTEIEDFLRCRLPCKIINSINAWPAVELWRPPWIRLMEMIPFMAKIRVAVSNESFSGVTQHYVDMTFFEFLNRATEGNYTCYMAQCPLLSDSSLAEEIPLSSLLEDIRLHSLLPTSEIEAHLWLNLKPVLSEYHYDSYQNFLCVINGCKTVELIPPSKLVDAVYLDNEAYNHMRNNTKSRFCVSLSKGDVLYIPEGWWHKVKSSTNTVAVSITWKGIDQKNLVEG